METHLLRSFLHVAELGNLSRASERLHLSQPALSRQIKQLEQSLGVELFERTGRGVRLTDAGELLERRARPLLADLEVLAAEVSGPCPGSIRWPHRRDPSIIRRITRRRHHPNVPRALPEGFSTYGDDVER